MNFINVLIILNNIIDTSNVWPYIHSQVKILKYKSKFNTFKIV